MKCLINSLVMLIIKGKELDLIIPITIYTFFLQLLFYSYTTFILLYIKH